jgi:hypothetical protein
MWDECAKVNPEYNKFGKFFLSGQTCFVRANLPQERWSTGIFVTEPPTWGRNNYKLQFTAFCGPDGQSDVIWVRPEWEEELDIMVMWAQGPYIGTARALREGHQRIIKAGPVSTPGLFEVIGAVGEWYWIGIEYQRIGWGGIGRGWMWGMIVDEGSWDNPIVWDRS